MTKRILSVTVHREIDTDPDLSWIGEYSDRPGPEETTVDRKEVGDWERGTYRYFIATMSSDDTGNPDSVAQDYERMEAYNRDVWWMVGVWVSAEVVLRDDVVQTIRSGGLWGIESDSEESYFDSVIEEELGQLRAELRACGFTDKQITTAYASLEKAST